MGATRLPNKMMLSLHGIPVVEWIFRRVSKSTGIDALVFAIPDTPSDDVLALHLERIGAIVYRGSEDDVLSRIYLAAATHGADYVVRICCDNPLVSPQAIDSLIEFYFDQQNDYAYNHIPRGNRYPDGLGAEITTFRILKLLHLEAKLPEQREHIFNYIWDNHDRFSIATFDPANPLLLRPDLKLDIDNWQDYYVLSEAGIYPDMGDTDIIMTLGAIK